MKNIIRLLAIVLPIGLLTGACTLLDPPTPGYSSTTIGSGPATRGDLGTLTYCAVDLILAGATDITNETPLIVASISDAQAVDSSSPLGNIISDMIKTRLVQDGRTVSEIRLRSGVQLNAGEGDFVLSRNRHVLAKGSRAAAVLTGTYAVGFDNVYISLRLVASSDAHILGAADFVVPRQEVAGLLERSVPRHG